MPDTHLVLLKRYAIAFEAEIAKGLLADFNIDCYLFDMNTIVNTSYSGALGGIRLMVSEEYLQEALSILDTHETSFEGEVESL
ncbi:hypothetical protein LBMAG36_15740 [Chlorobiota bacterium]|nr:hypothetical protein LBMAG36_15740 [Chlorobiota bacterium]